MLTEQRETELYLDLVIVCIFFFISGQRELGTYTENEIFDVKRKEKDAVLKWQQA